jgi:hypothetical protein
LPTEGDNFHFFRGANVRQGDSLELPRRQLIFAATHQVNIDFITLFDYQSLDKFRRFQSEMQLPSNTPPLTSAGDRSRLSRQMDRRGHFIAIRDQAAKKKRAKQRIGVCAHMAYQRVRFRRRGMDDAIRPENDPHIIRPVARDNPILYDISVNAANSPGNCYSAASYGFAHRIVHIGEGTSS